LSLSDKSDSSLPAFHALKIIDGKNVIDRINLLGIPVDKVKYDSMLLVIEDLIAQGGGKIVAPVNVDIMNKAHDNPVLAQFLRKADVIHSDGAGVVWGSALVGDAVPERVTSITLLWRLAERWNDGSRSLYFLGGPAGMAEAARDAIHTRFPNVRIVGCHRGHLSTPELVESALADIERSRPDMLLVGFGSPIQEEFIVEHRDRLNVVPVIWPVGALTSHIAGYHPRAPKLFRKAGAEWLWRLMLEPRRLWRRYILGNPIFMSRVLWFRLFGNRVAQ
jgi:N-acetylglucosaminyldiphosphoundecaprenol N-acetyl-beta-D-mannosaminyltransferase